MKAAVAALKAALAALGFEAPLAALGLLGLSLLSGCAHDFLVCAGGTGRQRRSGDALSDSADGAAG